jgi:PERQ amino acid-rich with GYF domain-containing protein
MKGSNHTTLKVVHKTNTIMIILSPFFQPFAKFGKIVLINSSVSILYTLTLCVALLVTIAPATYIPTWKSHLKATIASAAVCSVGVGVMYGISHVVDIPGPNGTPLFQSDN